MSEEALVPLVIKRKKMRLFRSPEGMITMLNLQGEPYYLRKSSYLTRVVTAGVEYVFPNRDTGFNPSHLWVFGAVKVAGESFIKNNPKFEAPEKLPTNQYNYNYDHDNCPLVGTDIKGAYWNIAKQMGVISETLYEKCSSSEFKTVRLAALAILGRAKNYQLIQNGNVVQNVLYRPADKAKDVYKAIRYQCYHHMQTLAEMLGNDFDCYKTDCIYYHDTPENRTLVTDYLRGLGFDFTILIKGVDDEFTE